MRDSLSSISNFHLEIKVSRVWRKSGEELNPSCMRIKFQDVMMVWGALSSAGVGRLSKSPKAAY